MKAAAQEDRFARDLALATGADEARAQPAFGRLCDLVRQAARRQLAHRGVGGEDAEDAIQAAFADLWRRRATLRARSGGEWYALVRQAVVWAHARRSRKEAADASLASEWGVPEEELPYLDAALAVAADRRRLHGAADGLWLGEAEDPDTTLGAAAVQLVLMDGLSREEAAATFGASPAAMDRWLGDPAVIARTLYSALCWSGDELAGYVLRPEGRLSPAEMDDLMAERGAVSLVRWSAREARVVCWRLRNGLREDEIEQACKGALDRSEIEAILARVREALPYSQIALAMRQSLEALGDPGPLSESGLWKRMAFEYALREVSLPQVVELAKPPADVAPFPLSAPQLNNWLSGGRLIRQLMAYLMRKETF